MKKKLFLSFICLTLLGCIVFAATNSTTGNMEGANTSSFSKQQPSAKKIDYKEVFEKIQGTSSNSTLITRTEEFYRKLHEELLDSEAFYVKFAKCQPAKLKIYSENKMVTDEVVYGKTKSNRCHYAQKQILKGETYMLDCTLPMSISIGFATSAYDALEYMDKYSEKSAESIRQNQEISKVLADYCKLIKKS